MRSVEEIQAEINSVSTRLATARLELKQLQAEQADIEKAQEGDTEWNVARRNYIDTGDMSGVTNWYNRRDQQRRDRENARLQELALSKEGAANGEGKSKHLMDLDDKVFRAKRAYDNYITSLTESGKGDSSTWDATTRNHVKTLKDAYNDAVRDYVREGGNQDKYGAIEDVQGSSTVNWRDVTNAIRILDRSANDNKYVTPDADIATVKAVMESIKDNPDYKDEYDEMAKGLVRAEERSESKANTQKAVTEKNKKEYAAAAKKLGSGDFSRDKLQNRFITAGKNDLVFTVGGVKFKFHKDDNGNITAKDPYGKSYTIN